MKTLRNLTLIAAFSSVNLWAGEYISSISARNAINLDSEEGREELQDLLNDRRNNRDTSPVVVEYSAEYDVTNLQIHIPLAGAVGRVLNHIPLVGGLFNRVLQNFDPPRTLTLRAILYPAANPKGFLLGVHGLQSNSRWYEQTGRDLADRGVTSLFFDRRGSGLSDSVVDANGRPMRGHHSSSAFDHLLAGPLDRALGDPAEFLEDIHVSYQHLYLVKEMQSSHAPIHLYANCFGARVAFAYAQEFENPSEAFASIITTSPGTNMKKGEISGLGDRLQVMAPAEVYTDVQLSDTDFTSNPDALAEMGDSRLSLILRKTTNRFLLSAGGLTKKMKQAFKTETLSEIPTLVVIPARDEIIFTEETQNTFAQSYPGPTLVTWLDAEHMIEFDTTARIDLVNVMTQWIADGVEAPAGYKAPAALGRDLQDQKAHGELGSLLAEKTASYRN